MKRFLLSIAAGITAALVAVTPMDASAQGRGRTIPSPSEVNEAVRVLIQRDSITCNVDAARFVGRNREGRTLYEVACIGAPGFLIQDTNPSTVVNCINQHGIVAAQRAADPNADVGAECTLERNLNVVETLAPYAQAAGVTCAIDEGRWVGATTAGATRYEVGCPGSDGFWFDVAADGSVSNVMTCLQVVGAGGTCVYSPAAEQAAWVASLAAPSGRACQPTQARYVGANRNTGVRYFEVGCSEGLGFMVRASPQNAFEAVIECVAATGINGGCTLSDASSVIAATAQSYREQLASANIPCAYVANSAPRQETSGDRRNVVEFQCSDRPWGLVAFLPNGAGSAEQIDCLTAEVRIGGCRLTPRAGLISQLNSLMATREDAACQVTEFRTIGRLTGADDPNLVGEVVELRCAQGEGYITVVRDTREAIARAQTCSVSAERGGSRCELGS